MNTKSKSMFRVMIDMDVHVPTQKSSPALKEAIIAFLRHALENQAIPLNEVQEKTGFSPKALLSKIMEAIAPTVQDADVIESSPVLAQPHPEEEKGSDALEKLNKELKRHKLKASEVKITFKLWHSA